MKAMRTRTSNAIFLFLILPFSRIAGSGTYNEMNADCQDYGGHICTFAEHDEACAVDSSVWGGRAAAWMGESSANDYFFRRWKSDCSSNVDNSAVLRTSTDLHGFCCARGLPKNSALTVTPTEIGGNSYTCAPTSGICYKKFGVSRTSAGDMMQAIRDCGKDGAHVCTQGDINSICADGSDPLSEDMWFGDPTGSNNWAFKNQGTCGNNMDGDATTYGTDRQYYCCRPKSLDTSSTTYTSLVGNCPAAIASDLHSISPTDGGLCISSEQSADTFTNALLTCKAMDAHVCTLSDYHETCAYDTSIMGSGNGMWSGTHGYLNGYFMVKQAAQTCSTGYSHMHLQRTSSEKKFHCCNSVTSFDFDTTDVVSTTDYDVGMTCSDSDFTAHGSVCFHDPETTGNYITAQQTCSNLGGAVCTHSQLSQVCAKRSSLEDDPFYTSSGGDRSDGNRIGDSRGWVGDFSAAGVHGVWVGSECSTLNDNEGPAVDGDSEDLPFRCCDIAIPDPSDYNNYDTMEAPTGYTCTSDFSLCYKSQTAATLETAFQTCAADNARVCSEQDFQLMCADSVDALTAGDWLGNLGASSTSASWSSYGWTASISSCDSSAVLPGTIEVATNTNTYKCCRSGEIRDAADPTYGDTTVLGTSIGEAYKSHSVNCPTGVSSLKTDNGEVCASETKGPASMPSAVGTCSNLGAHVCSASELFQLTGTSTVSTVFDSTPGWFSDKAKTTGGDWEGEVRPSEEQSDYLHILTHHPIPPLLHLRLLQYATWTDQSAPYDGITDHGRYHLETSRGFYCCR
jgi:hypothetical protein